MIIRDRRYYENRISLLESRETHNSNIVRKLKRKLRKLTIES